MYAAIKESPAELSNPSVSVLPDRALTHTCSLLADWPLFLGKSGAFHRPMDGGHFSLQSCYKASSPGTGICSGGQRCQHVKSWFMNIKQCCAQGQRSATREQWSTSHHSGNLRHRLNGLIGCMHFIICLGQKLPRQGKPSNQTILHRLLKSRFVLRQHKQFNLMFSLLSKHWVLHLNPREGEECFLFISKCTSMSEFTFYSQWVKRIVPLICLKYILIQSTSFSQKLISQKIQLFF